MKEITFSIIVTLLFAQPAFSQFSVTANIGANIGHSEVYHVPYIESRPSSQYTGFYVGIAPEYQVADRWKLITEFQYAQLGSSYTYLVENDEFNHSYRSKGKYLRLLPLISYAIVKDLALQVGPNMGYLIGDKTRKINWPANQADPISFGQMVKNWDAGLTIGLQYSIDLFNAHVSYYHGLKDISDVSYTNSNGNLIADASQYNHYFQVGLGIDLFKSGE